MVHKMSVGRLLGWLLSCCGETVVQVNFITRQCMTILTPKGAWPWSPC